MFWFSESEKKLKLTLVGVRRKVRPSYAFLRTNIMFEQLKQMKKLKQMQDSFKKERFEVENQGIRVVINGNLEVQEIYLNQDLDKSSQEQILKQCLNEVVKKAQMALAKQLF